jgi:hypothetical protein
MVLAPPCILMSFPFADSLAFIQSTFYTIINEVKSSCSLAESKAIAFRASTHKRPLCTESFWPTGFTFFKHTFSHDEGTCSVQLYISYQFSFRAIFFAVFHA